MRDWVSGLVFKKSLIFFSIKFFAFFFPKQKGISLLFTILSHYLKIMSAFTLQQKLPFSRGMART